MSVIAKDEIVAKIAEIAERVGEPEGIEIVEVQLLGAGRGRLLRIFIDRALPVLITPLPVSTASRASRTPIASLFRSR